MRTDRYTAVSEFTPLLQGNNRGKLYIQLSIISLCCLGGGPSHYTEQLLDEKLFDADFPDTIVLTSDGIHE